MDAADSAVGGAVASPTSWALPDATCRRPAPATARPSFDQRMSTLAWLIRSNLGLRVACISYDDGFDFHDTQVEAPGAEHDKLSRDLSAFQADLEARGIADRVITLVWSEFGRRVEDNDSGGGGTDHGAGGLAMVIGTGVNPASPPSSPASAPGSRRVGQPQDADRLPPDLHVPARPTGWGPTRRT